MHRIDGAGHVNNRFVSEDPAANRPPTEITPEIMNAFQEEMASFIEWALGAGSLNKNDNTQFRQAALAKFLLVSAFNDHLASIDPHPVYLTAAEGDIRYALANALAAYALKGANSDITSLSAVVSGSVFRKNAAENGGFDVWQRGTNFSGITNVPVYTADRWFGFRNAVTAGMTVSRQTATGSAQYALRAQRDAGDASTACIGIGTCFETSRSKRFAGKQVTISFLAKAGANYSAAGSILPVAMYTGTGTNQSSTLMVSGNWTGGAGTSQNVVISPVQGRYSATFNVPAGITQLGFTFTPQMVGVAGANDWYEIEDVQIECSPVATDFEVLPVPKTLELCQRYYMRWDQQDNFLGGSSTAGTNSRFWQSFPVQMRVAPTGNYSAVGALTVNDNSTSQASTAISFTQPTKNGVRFDVTHVALGAQKPVFAQLQAGAWIDFSAEL